MLALKNRVLMTAGLALAGFAASASTASANYFYNPGDIFGGGASLPAPYLRQTFDCYAEPTQLIIAGSPPVFVTEPAFNYLGKPPQNCATQHVVTTETTYYVSASSGIGIFAAFGHDPTQFGFINSADNQYFPSVQFGFSETPLSSTDVGVSNNGGTETQGSKSISIGGANQVTCTSGSTNPYPNPLQCYGPLVQFPFSIDPVVFAYNSVYEKVLNSDGSETDYHFHIKFPRKDSSGGLRLSQQSYCKIFNGQITNWNDPALKTDNGGQSLEDPNDPTPPSSWGVPLQIVGRADSAGATTIFTRHLANACAALTGNQYTTGTSTLPSSLRGPTYSTSNPNYPPVTGETPGKFTLATGNIGVAQYVAFTAVPGGSNPSNCSLGAACIQLGRITYTGADFVLPYVLNTNTNNFNLNTPTLQNTAGAWEEATPATVLAAFGTIQAPQSNANGTYCASCLNWGMRNDPSAWVQSSAPTSPLANPAGKTAYPIVGTANWIAYTCYATKAQEQSLVGVMTYIDQKSINTDPKKGILSSSGLSPLPAQWRTAIDQTFLTNKDGLGLTIEPVGAAGACSAPGLIGG
jgi:phosphate transport system substrate-binding protein